MALLKENISENLGRLVLAFPKFITNLGLSRFRKKSQDIKAQYVNDKKHLLVVANEPTPYNIDLFNAFARTPGIKILVFHTKEKSLGNYHDFKKFPDPIYPMYVSSGKSLASRFICLLKVIKMIMRPNQIILITGYNSIPFVGAILTCSFLRFPFALWADHFNIGSPEKGGLPIRLIRDFLRRLIFRNAFAILTCGKPGIKSALRVGCPVNKLVNFPYVIDFERLKLLQQKKPPIVSEILKRSKGRTNVFYSGQMIPRKGLDTLLKALNNIISKGLDSVFLVAEGEGPLRMEYEHMASNLGISDKCCFVGFRQMDEHACLLSISDIVVVPSKYDPWGIVVHEGMLMAKPVIASDGVGSAIDRIKHGVNGYIFTAGDSAQLSHWLRLLLSDRELRVRIGDAAKYTAKDWSPKRNVNSLLKAIDLNLDCRIKEKVGYFSNLGNGQNL